MIDNKKIGNMNTAKGRLDIEAGYLFDTACERFDALLDISDNAGIRLQKRFADAMFEALYPEEWRSQEKKRKKREADKIEKLRQKNLALKGEESE